MTRYVIGEVAVQCSTPVHNLFIFMKGTLTFTKSMVHPVFRQGPEYDNFNVQMHSLKLTVSSRQEARPQKGTSLSIIHFEVRSVSFRDGICNDSKIYL